MGSDHEVETSTSKQGTEIGTARHAVLDYYYEHVLSLQDYLTACLPTELASTLLDKLIDGPSYVQLLQDTRVAWSDPAGAPRPFDPQINQGLTLPQLIRRAQRDLLSCSSDRNNVLCFGFVKARLSHIATVVH